MNLGINYYNATFNKTNFQSNDENIDYYQQQNEMIHEEMEVAKNDLNDEHEEIDNFYQGYAANGK